MVNLYEEIFFGWVFIIAGIGNIIRVIGPAGEGIAGGEQRIGELFLFGIGFMALGGWMVNSSEKKSKREVAGNIDNEPTEVTKKPFKLEKDMQKLFEANLEAITGLNLVKSEFTIKAQRFDTFAYDADSRSFVIIEYKRERNFSVVDQGVSYLNLMLENKAEFIVEYNESQQQNLKRSDVDWSQSKVIFVSPAFTDFQKQASNFKDLPIELWEIKQYEGDIIVVNPVKKSKAAPTIKTIQAPSNSELEKVSKEVKVYTEEDHLAGKSDETIELYETYKQAFKIWTLR